MDLQYLPYVATVVQLSTAIIGTIHYSKYSKAKERFFFYFLWFAILVEIGGAVLSDVFVLPNFWLYNLYTLISFSFYFFWYHSILKRSDFQKMVLTFAVLFVCVAFWNFIFQSWSSYHKYTFITGALLTMVCTIFHFWQLLNSDEILEVKYKLSFWISTGLLLFNMGMIPLMLLSSHLNFSEIQFYILIITLNFILYGCYSIGFLWTKAKYNRS